jgi:hypothetical protein
MLLSGPVEQDGSRFILGITPEGVGILPVFIGAYQELPRYEGWLMGHQALPLKSGGTGLQPRQCGQAFRIGTEPGEIATRRR